MMNQQEAVLFLFGIVKEMKRSFENPVIYLTMKDYSDYIFNSLVDMRTALLKDAMPERVVEIVNTFHLTWLQAVQDIEHFKRRINDTPRETITKAIDFTIECVHKRHKYLKKYIYNLNNTMTEPEKHLLQSDLGIMGDMEEIINFALIEKKRCLSVSADKAEFYLIVSDETEELMNWLDRLNNYLAIQFSKVLELKVARFTSDLNQALQQIIDKVIDVSTPEVQKVTEEPDAKGKSLGSMARVVQYSNDVKIGKIIEKIQNLEKRINQLNTQSSSAVMALQHKTLFLEERLQSLENLKVSLNLLKNQDQNHRSASDEGSLREDDICIFNHLLPQQERFRLVEQLVRLWEGAIIGEKKSIISILSATDMNEVFSDELGNFSIDKYGRKLYKNPDDDGLYQLNENNELVPMRDDEEHVYFYDECGRYYLDCNRMRVYKSHARASEYMLHRGIVMLKLNEIENGIEYRFDHLGRYYIDKAGNRIYRDKNSEDEYISDGLGNLTKTLDIEQDYDYCPVEPLQTADSLYLKQEVGAALRTCVAEVVLTQPLDPIKNLADRLEKFYFSKRAKESQLVEQKAMYAERERIRLAEKSETHPPSSIQAEESSTDYNFIHYKS